MSKSLVEDRIEQGKQAVNRLNRNVEAIKNGYGWCGHCHDTYDWKEGHTIGKNGGMFPYCKECHDVISTERKKELVTQLVNEWIGYLPDSIDEYLKCEVGAFRIIEAGG